MDRKRKKSTLLSNNSSSNSLTSKRKKDEKISEKTRKIINYNNYDKNNINKLINIIYEKVISYNLKKNKPHFNVSIEIIQVIINKINELVYNNELESYIENTLNRKKYRIIDVPIDRLHNIESFFETTQYEISDNDFIETKYDLKIPITFLNKYNNKKNIFYSGGFLTKNKIIFIILMTLHEIIHIIEGEDTLLNRPQLSAHTVFFYKTVYDKFKFISQFSNIINISDTIIVPEKKILEFELLTEDKYFLDGIEELKDGINSREPFNLYYVHSKKLLETSFTSSLNIKQTSGLKKIK